MVEDEIREGITAAIADVFECSMCSNVQPSLQQLRLHMFREHGISREARRYISSFNDCLACLRRFPTRTQAIRHVYGSRKCSQYPDFCTEVPAEEVTRLDTDETKRLQRVAATSAHESCTVRCMENLCGPLLEVFQHCFKGRPRYHGKVLRMDEIPEPDFVIRESGLRVRSAYRSPIVDPG